MIPSEALPPETRAEETAPFDTLHFNLTLQHQFAM